MGAAYTYGRVGDAVTAYTLSWTGRAPEERPDGTETSTMLESILCAYTKLATLRDGEDGQALLEYALILALASIVCAAALTLLGTSVSDFLSSAANAF